MQYRAWGWVIPVLLIAAWLTSSKLNYDALSYDEHRSYVVAGAESNGPLEWPHEVWGRVSHQSPDQAMGFPLVIWWWGKFVGWSEVAARTLPYLIGMLAIAITYRIGRDLFNPFVGISAVTILATSIFYITFMHKFRVFTFVALGAVMVLWCYWRIALHPKRPGIMPIMGLAIGGVILIYGHYLTTPLIGVIGLFHLFFVRKTRCWWLPIFIFIPVAATIYPELQILLRGYDRNINNIAIQEAAISWNQILIMLVQFFSNDFSWLFIILLIIAIFAAYQVSITSRPTQSDTQHNTTYSNLKLNLIYLWWSALGLLLAIIVMSEVGGIFLISRVRYLVGLWSLLSLIIGTGLWMLYRWNRWIGVGILLLWGGLGIYTTLQDELMWIGAGDQIRVHPWRELNETVLAYGDPDDTLILQGKWYPQFDHYTPDVPIRSVIYEYNDIDNMRGIVGVPFKRIWWAINLQTDQKENLATFQALIEGKGYAYCDTYIDHTELRLDLWTRSDAFCPGGETIYQFGDLIALKKLVTERTDNNQLVIQTGWSTAPDFPIHTYSVGFHVIDTNSGDLVTQMDVGLDNLDGPFIALETAIDLSNLERGDYELRVVVYDWVTGDRLPGSNTSVSPSLQPLQLLNISNN